MLGAGQYPWKTSLTAFSYRFPCPVETHLEGKLPKYDVLL